MNYLEQFKQQQLRTCQLKQLGILEEIDRICRKHNISYWLDGGSLLGAVRHGGFIPWDDDIDIAMPQDDARRFAEVAPKELPSTLRLQTPDTENTREPIMKVRDLNSFYVEGNEDFSLDYSKGLFVDIFPMIDYPNVSRAFCRKYGKDMSRCYSILHHSHQYSARCSRAVLLRRTLPVLQTDVEGSLRFQAHRYIHVEHTHQQRLRHNAPSRLHIPVGNDRV